MIQGAKLWSLVSNQVKIKLINLTKLFTFHVPHIYKTGIMDWEESTKGWSVCFA